jgi:seryl-tRNA synthetase
MGAVEFLSQAYHIDLRIQSKLEQLESLNSLATKASTAYGNEPVSGSRDVQRREAVICKIVDLQNDINADIDSLVDIKREVRRMIESVPSVDGKTVLEMRYINYKKWEEIAVSMHYVLRNVHYIHDKAIAYLEENDG